MLAGASPVRGGAKALGSETPDVGGMPASIVSAPALNVLYSEVGLMGSDCWCRRPEVTVLQPAIGGSYPSKTVSRIVNFLES